MVRLFRATFHPAHGGEDEMVHRVHRLLVTFGWFS